MDKDNIEYWFTNYYMQADSTCGYRAFAKKFLGN